MVVNRSAARAVVGAVVASLAAALAASAQTLPAPSLAVHARVVAQRSAWDAPAGAIVTYVELEVLEDLRGAGTPSRIVLKQLGGTVGSLTLWVAGQAAFQVGEDALLYLSISRADQTLHTTALARGKLAPTADALAAARSVVQGRPAPPFVPYPAAYEDLRRQPAPAYSLLPTDGVPARWHEVDDGTPVFVDRPPFPGTWSHASGTHVADAVGLWAGSGMELDLRVGASNLSASACPALSFTGNGRIALAFNDPCGLVTDWVIGGGYYTMGDQRTVNGVTYQKFLQGFVVLNDSGPQSTAGGCFRDAVTHGLGHALGLGHTSADAIMQAAPPSGCATAARGLGADDVAGVTAIYEGIAAATAPPDTPTAFTVTSQLSTVTMGWTPASTGGQAQRYLIDAGTLPGVYNIGTITVNAPSTSTGVGNVPAGIYYLRLRAENALGGSAPTPERSVNVGNCTAPGPPASLTGSSNDAVVNLQWTPPAAGIAQGYQVVAGSAPGLANLAVIPLPSTVTTLGGPVPYATYYVRVHATNVCGISPPSPEVTLVVQPCAAPPGTYHVRIIATNPCGQSGASNEVTVVVP
jgi:hypothetical protein